MLPKISHLQFLALDLASGSAFIRGIELRRQFLAVGAGNRSLPAFYQFMDRLVEDGYVNVKKVAHDGSIESEYRTTRKGAVGLKASRTFYARSHLGGVR